MCVLSALIGVTNAKWLGATHASLDINIFTQIGFVVLVGLASKNAILIVEFAKLIHARRASRSGRRRSRPAGCGCGRSS